MPEIKLYSWNVNGIRAAAKKGLKEWIDGLKAEVICFQETKAQDDQIPPQIANQDRFRLYHHAAVKKGYSGVLTLSKTKPKLVEFKLGVEEFDTEGRVIATKFEEFTLFNIYFPNGKKNKERLDYKMRFYHHFFDFVSKLRKDGEKIIFCGDINTAHKEIDLAHPKPNSKYSGFLPIECAWIDKIIESGFYDTFRIFDKNAERYTWWSQRTNARAKNVGWRIDYFFIDKSLRKNLVNAEIHSDIMGSDHCPISITLRF